MVSCLHFNYIETCALSILAYYTGKCIAEKVRVIRDYFIPVPVVGGTVFAVLFFVLRSLNIRISFDPLLEQFFMSMFFVSIGFFVRTSTLCSDMKRVIRMTILIAVALVVQNLISTTNAHMFGYSPLWGLCSGSMAMVGGFGSVSVFGHVIEELGHETSILAGMGMSVLGLIGGGILGCPLAIRLIKTYNIPVPNDTPDQLDIIPASDTIKKETAVQADRMMYALLLLIGAMGIGSLAAAIFRHYNIFIPIYAGGICLGFILGNIVKVPQREIMLLSDISLNIFLSISLMILDLSLLMKVLLPLFSCIIWQMLFMALFCWFVVWRFIGRDYLAAVIICGFAGFGLGSLSTGMANITSLTKKYGDIGIIFVLMPIISSIADAINGSMIVLLINLLK